jgi:sugar lactone lactonase YvrE
MVFDTSGNLYVSSEDDNRVRKITPAGIISTFAGTGYYGLAGDYGPATNAKMKSPRGLLVDAAGNVVIADGISYRIRKVNSAGIILPYAGAGTGGYGGDHGPAAAASLYWPNGMTWDPAGNLVFADAGNCVVRKIDAAGIITTIVGGYAAGTGAYTGDGGAALSARLDHPYDVDYDAAGNLYIADANNHVIRKVTPAGVISTVAGTGMGHGTTTGLFSGDGLPAVTASLNWPTGVRVDGIGNIFIADHGNNRIRKVNTSGIMSTYAGNGVWGYGTGDGGPATAAVITEANSLVIDKDGNLYVTDFSNGAIRKIWAVLHLSSSAGGDTVCSGNMITFHAEVSSAGFHIGYQWKRNGINTGVDSSNYSTGTLSTGDVITCNLYNTVSGDTIVSSDTMNMFVYSTPSAGTITGSTTLCAGATIALSDAAGGGVWSSSSASAGVTGAGVVSGVSAGSSVISYTVADAHCPATATLAITVNPLPVAGTITGGTDTVCFGRTVNFTDISPGGVWSLFDGILATVSGGTVTALAAGEGADTVYYTVTNGCGTARASHRIAIMNCAEGVGDIYNTENNFSVYPNPGSGRFNVMLRSANDGPVQIVVTNVLGTLQGVYSTTTNKTAEIKLDVPAGVYFLSATTGSNRYNAVVSVVR